MADRKRLTSILPLLLAQVRQLLSSLKTGRQDSATQTFSFFHCLDNSACHLPQSPEMHHPLSSKPTGLRHAQVGAHHGVHTNAPLLPTSIASMRQASTFPPPAKINHINAYQHLAEELKHINTQPRQRNETRRPDSLKEDLLYIHRRHTVQLGYHKKRRHRNRDGNEHQKLLLDILLSAEQKSGQTPINPPRNEESKGSSQNSISLGPYTKDYILLSREHKRAEKYRIHTKKKRTDHQPPCVVCSRHRLIEKVCFPCEHLCMCNSCLDRLSNKKGNHKCCPLCNAAISVVLENSDKVQEEYWRWIEEVSTIPVALCERV